MSETAEKAKSLFESPKPYDPAARLTLPVLVQLRGERVGRSRMRPRAEAFHYAANPSTNTE